MILGLACIPLGFWQLDRLAERKARNEHVRERLSRPRSELPAQIQDPEGWAYRRVRATGEFDFEREILLRNRAWEGRPGVHLITPLLLQGAESAVLIDRGWIPQEERDRVAREAFEVEGPVAVRGIVRLTQPQPSWAFLADPTPSSAEQPLQAWRVVDIPNIARQLPYALLPIYVEATEPVPQGADLPRPDPSVDLSEGPHLSYAIQWFAFASIALVGGATWWKRQLADKE
jgi:surfeit locus 1 family protein